MDRKIKQNKLKNKKAVLTGTTLFVFLVIYFSEFLQFLTAVNFVEVGMSIDFILLRCSFVNLSESNTINFFVLFSDLIFIMLFVEISYRTLKKIPIGFWRFTLILFIVLSLGFIIISVFYGFFTSIVFNTVNDWITYYKFINASLEEKIIYSLGFVLSTFLYLTRITRRLIKYIKP